MRTYYGENHVSMNHKTGVVQIGASEIPEDAEQPNQEPNGPKLNRALIILSLFVFGCLGLKADSLDAWHWRNPLPQGDTLNAVASGGGNFVAVGGNTVAV